ncbi:MULTISPECIES: 16S rRNA (uracil(1498)-N(3))-methyltransferase [unclassified Enterococcus]|uniref:16S rRNA (uracil(1498)-N(3))-methyltransferase n=1 Tax=unclassified Enterococcus TaxID=2608891 RepID=UPI001A91F651|nr:MULTISPECIES: 16S rRNA (uracil(1498)-N(3))-methyltransferase [unclassified Enterococcus]MBO0462387.1 16S rRNA (uracil(1498)-N(3))-methyltransferase [Enterococcus sp. DIV1298c]MBO1300669.1 16S rRNA (uracil(1498)-N(3))-methyltransferase [Enterococcus sp. DIV1271a]
MQRYFLDEPYRPQERYVLEGEAYHHMARVMRMAAKDHVYLAFNDQIAIVAEITEMTEKEVFLVEVAKESVQKELPCNITIASGYPKGDKLDWIVQKGTELGAHAFVGFPAAASVVKWDAKKRKKRQERLAKIAQEAAEQSHRQVVPQVTLMETEKEFYASLTSYDVLLIAYEESAKQGEAANLVKILQSVMPGTRILAVFGPEGGLSAKEVAYFEEQGGILCGLGPRILRTETAPLYLLSAASFQLELQASQEK